MKNLIKQPAGLVMIVLIIASWLLILGNVRIGYRTENSNKYVEKIKTTDLKIRQGEKIYERYCIACHGTGGKGDGPEAYQLETKPTDFTSGNIKFKSTPYGTLPVENDIVSILKSGVRTTAMLPQLQLNDEQMHDIAAYIMSLMPKDQKTGKPIDISKAPSLNTRLLEKGKKLFQTNCISCHGTDAKGNGPL